MKKAFGFLLLSYGLSNFGDTLRVIAVTVLIFNITGSGLSAGISVFYSLIPGIILSGVAGKLGDMLQPKYVLASIELIKSILGIIFLSLNNPAMIFILLLVHSTLDVIYNPPFRKICVSLAGKDKIFKGNSFLSGVSGLTNILGSLFSAVIISTWDASLVFLLNCILHALSAAIIILLRADHAGIKTYKKTPASIIPGKNLRSLVSSININIIKEILIINTVVSFLVISVNMAFYPFAFDILKVTEKGWSFLMSIFYTANILAMIINIVFIKKLEKIHMPLVYLFLSILAVIWFFYSITNNLAIILFLQLIEGISLSLCGILLLTKLQIATRTKYLSSITGLSDFINSTGKIAGMVYTYLLIKYLSVKHVFALNSILLISFIMTKAAVSGWSHLFAAKNIIYKGNYIACDYKNKKD